MEMLNLDYVPQGVSDINDVKLKIELDYGDVFHLNCFSDYSKIP